MLSPQQTHATNSELTQIPSPVISQEVSCCAENSEGSSSKISFGSAGKLENENLLRFSSTDKSAQSTPVASPLHQKALGDVTNIINSPTSDCYDNIESLSNISKDSPKVQLLSAKEDAQLNASKTFPDTTAEILLTEANRHDIALNKHDFELNCSVSDDGENTFGFASEDESYDDDTFASECPYEDETSRTQTPADIDIDQVNSTKVDTGESAFEAMVASCDNDAELDAREPESDLDVGKFLMSKNEGKSDAIHALAMEVTSIAHDQSLPTITTPETKPSTDALANEIETICTPISTPTAENFGQDLNSPSSGEDAVGKMAQMCLDIMDNSNDNAALDPAGEITASANKEEKDCSDTNMVRPIFLKK